MDRREIIESAVLAIPVVIAGLEAGLAVRNGVSPADVAWPALRTLAVGETVAVTGVLMATTARVTKAIEASAGDSIKR